MSASRHQTRSQGPLPPENDPDNKDSGSHNNESEEEPARGRRETPRQHGRARGGQRRRPQEREPEDFNFMPQHANPGGNQEPNAGNNENMDPNPPIPPQDQQNPAPQPDVNQQ